MDVPRSPEHWKDGRDDVAQALVKIKSGRDDEARSGPTAGKDYKWTC